MEFAYSRTTTKIGYITLTQFYSQWFDPAGESNHMTIYTCGYVPAWYCNIENRCISISIPQIKAKTIQIIEKGIVMPNGRYCLWWGTWCVWGDPLGDKKRLEQILPQWTFKCREGAKTATSWNRIGGIIFSVLASSSVDRRFEPRSDQPRL